MTHGLLNTKDNKFYLVANNHHQIKILQLLTMKHRLFLCVNISQISNLDITDDVCHCYGISKPLTKFLTPDVDTSLYGAAVIESPGDKDETLWANIHMLDRLVGALENFVAQYEKTQKERYKDMINGLKELEAFVKSFMPNDPNITDFVNREIEIKTSIINRAEKIKNQIFAELMQSDPWRPEFKQTVIGKINELKSIDIELFTMIKNICLTKL